MNSRFCPVCNVNLSEEDPTHIGSNTHRFNYLLLEWNKYRSSLVKNRHGIEISISFEGHLLVQNAKKGKHFYQITPSALLQRGNTLNFKCTIVNTRAKDMILLTSGNVLHPYTMFSLNDPNNNNQLNNGKRIQLMPNSKYTVMVNFSQGNTILPGGYNIPVCFTFQTVDNEVFSIARSINISVEEELSEEYILYKSPFKGISWDRKVQILEPTHKIPYSNKYVIPFEKRRIFSYGLEEHPSMRQNDFRMLRNLQQEMQPGYVTEEKYQNFWHNVLWLEEMSQVIGLQQYNMEEVELNLMENSRLELVVPGLVEKRPSVIVGDMIDIRLHEDHTGYRGIIRRVNNMSVEIDDVHRELIWIIESRGKMSKEYDVRFVLSRLPLERQHSGVDQVVKKQLLPCLFPPANPRVRVRNILRTIENGEFFDQNITTNQEQKTAVLNILNGTSGSYPYIVFGPPGTGKTVTLVEAILQLKKKTKHNILVCAPSNAACDMLTEKLLVHCKKSELLRIMSSSVDITAVHEIVLSYSNYKEQNIFQHIDSASLRKYRIIVTTLVLVGKYIGYYTPDVVFIDEAAQACEPEACIAISLIERGNRIVLAGDPKQLGPSTSSEVAKKYGLEKSLLERLMETDLYSGNNPNYKTMLIKNFRNHSTILYLPNKHFYGGLLEANSQRAQFDPISKVFVFQKIQGLFKKYTDDKIDLNGHAIEFCSIISKESREGKSPSYYNKKELQMVIRYIKALQALDFEDESEKVSTSDIGVVTPYVRQVHKLKGLLQDHGIEGVEVGTTETFQGREKRIIIISTVRAQKDLLLYDKQYKLGFVKNEKRFNVAVTRAMSKLIVIGCAHVLATDVRWLSYIDICENIHGFCGAPFARRNDDTINAITERIKDIEPDTQYNKK